MNITRTDETLSVVCDFHPDFITAAHRLNGKWARPAWLFDVRDEARVREILLDVFGTDGETPVETATVRITDTTVNSQAIRDTLWLCGREVAVRATRDSRVRLGPGVVILEGGFSSKGGSAKSPNLSPDEGLVLEIRDVPKTLLDAVRTLPGVTIIEDAPAPVDPPAYDLSGIPTEVLEAEIARRKPPAAV